MADRNIATRVAAHKRANPAVYEEFHGMAGHWARLVRGGLIEPMHAHNRIERDAHVNSPWQWTDSQRQDLADYALTVFVDEIMDPTTDASAAIRLAIAPMLSARRSRTDILLAAYRVTDGRLPAADVEAIITAEIAAYMARVRNRT